MNSRQRILVIICLSIVSVFLTLEFYRHETAAQSQDVSLRIRLEELKRKVEAGERLVTFQFITPISEGKELWTIGDPNDERRLHISEIGDDYFCLRETLQAAILIRCVPFINIASISFLET